MEVLYQLSYVGATPDPSVIGADRVIAIGADGLIADPQTRQRLLATLDALRKHLQAMA
jgi:hypothetical protein